MKKLHLLLILLTTFMLSACSYNYQITEAQVTHYLKEHVNYQKTYRLGSLAAINTDLNQLTVHIGRNNQQQIQLSGLINLRLSSFIKNINFNCHGNFSAKPIYSQTEGAIYLTDIQVKLNNINPSKYSTIVSEFLPKLEKSLKTYLQSHPIYKLNDKKTKQALIKRFAEKIDVKDGYIDIIFKP
ncbi:MAG: putative lipoprotein YceB [Candidatus Celerinatantimonas neptuna]|nr:MAG: putative lipoprotein YceB [Candidatus Celerinatantimonas neptuna]